MEHTLNDERVDAFWEWFVLNEERIVAILNNEESRDKESLVQSLNDWVLQLGMFSWEMGRGQRRPYFFTISPNRDPELFALSQQIIDAAPELPQWELNDAKPAQQWDLRLNIYDNDLNEWRVNASSWKFILLSKPHNKVKVRILAKNIAKLDAEARASAAELYVSGVAGEALRIRHVAGIEITSSFGPEEEADAHPFPDLKAHIEDQLGLWEED